MDISSEHQASSDDVFGWKMRNLHETDHNYSRSKERMMGGWERGDSGFSLFMRKHPAFLFKLYTSCVACPEYVLGTTSPSPVKCRRKPVLQKS